MVILSKKIKTDIIKIILSQEYPFGLLPDNKGIIYFLEKIWDLKTMPSSDPRFNNAEEDIFQHMLRNDDWDLDFLFFERLMLQDNDEKIGLFIETILHPSTRIDENDITSYYLLINPYLEKEDFSLVITEYNEDELPIFKITKKADADKTLKGLKINNIIFFAAQKLTGTYYKESSHQQPSTSPSFVLAHQNNWNDNGRITNYYLFYYPQVNKCISIGNVKIMHKTALDTSVKMASNFYQLDEDFCSLGQDESYYSKLKEVFGREFESILFALQDTAFFPEIHTQYEKNSNFLWSLLRTDGAERLLREIKYKIYGYDLSNLYSFQYKFNPSYSKKSVDIDFHFNNNAVLPNRIYGLIGKNGIGKTQLITSLPRDIAKKNNLSFTPRTPLFSKVVAVSYSVFDSFTPLEKNSFFQLPILWVKRAKW